MRTKIGKRIGPVPIALVAVLALAAFISAGLSLTPGGAQAQGSAVAASGASIADLVIDVNEAVVDAAEDADDYSVAALFTFAEGVTAVRYTTSATSDDSVLAISDVSISDAGVVTISSNVADTVGTTTITVQASATPAGGNTPQTATATFDIVVVQNPIELSGMMVTSPDLDNAEDGVQFPDGACGVGTNLDGELTSGPRDHDFDSETSNEPIELGTNRSGGTVGEIMVSGGDCLSSGDSVDVSLTSGDNMVVNYLVYVTGGDDFNDVEPMVAEDGLEEHYIQLPIKLGRDDQKETISVSRSMADGKGIVYLIGYNQTFDTNELTSSATTFNADADFVIKVVFQDPPSSAKDADDKPFSAIQVDEVPRTETTADVDVQVRDANGHPVSGFVNLTVAGGDDVVFTASNLKTHRARVASNGWVRDIKVGGLPKSGPFKIQITAEIAGLTLTKNIVRKGDAAMVEATAYVCVDDASEAKDHDINAATPPTVATDDICIVEIAAVNDEKAGNEPDEVVALGPSDAFFISAKATDSAGNKVEDETDLSWAITKDTDNEDDAKRAIDADLGGTDKPIFVSAGTEAIAGTYSITVMSGDGEASTAIMITVSDVASMIMVSCEPMIIPTDSGLTDCTVTVTDANGNVPSNLHEDNNTNTVRVAVRSRDAQLIGVNEHNDTDLDAMGMANFSILLREDATEGASITVSVSSEIADEMLRTNTTVTYGMAMPEVVEPGPEMMEELMAPMNVMTGPFNSGGVIQVSWDTVAGATGYIVIAIDTGDFSAIAEPVNGGDVDAWNLGGLSSGVTYDVYVASTNRDGFELSDAMQVTAN